MRVILKKGSKTPVHPHSSSSTSAHSAAAAAAAHQNPAAGSTGSASDSRADAASSVASGSSGGSGAIASVFAVGHKKRGRSSDGPEGSAAAAAAGSGSVPEEQKPAAAGGRKRRHLDTTFAAASASAGGQGQHVRFEDQPNYLSPTAAAASIQQALLAVDLKPSSSASAPSSHSASGGSSTNSSSNSTSSRRPKSKTQAGILRPPTRVPPAASVAAAAAAAAACLPKQATASALGNTNSRMGIPARHREEEEHQEEASYVRAVRGRGSSRSPSPNDEDRRGRSRHQQDPAGIPASLSAAEDDPANDDEIDEEEDPAADAGISNGPAEEREDSENNVLSVIPRSFNAQSRGASSSPSSSSSRRSGINRSRSNSPESSSAAGGRRSSSNTAGTGSGGRKKRSSPLTAGALSQYQDALKKRHLEMVEQEGDGNCLFRAVSLQVYGEPNNHAEARKRCMDFMAKNEEHFAQFIPDEPFRTYVARKRILGVHGNNPEIQAFSELFNRPVEIYEPQNGASPINIFQGEYKTSDDPIRLSYHDGNHYNAIVDPYKPTAGLGLGLPGLKPGLADEMQLDKAKKLSDKAEVDRTLKESRMAHDLMYEKKAFALSEMEAADFDLEQAVIQSSLQSYLHDEGRKRSPHHHRHLHRDRARRQGTPSPTGHSPYAGGASHRHRHGSPTAAASRDDDSYSVCNSLSGASSSASAGFASAATARRSGSPPYSATAAASNAPTGPVPGAGNAIGGDEYPQCVQELVMNGFELPKVLRAYELVGDNFDSLLSFLMSSTG